MPDENKELNNNTTKDFDITVTFDEHPTGFRRLAQWYRNHRPEIVSGLLVAIGMGGVLAFTPLLATIATFLGAVGVYVTVIAIVTAISSGIIGAALTSWTISIYQTYFSKTVEKQQRLLDPDNPDKKDQLNNEENASNSVDSAKLEKDPTPVNSPKIEKASDSVDPAKLEKDPTPVHSPKIEKVSNSVDPAKVEKDPTPVHSPKIEKVSNSVDPAKLEKDPTPINSPKIEKASDSVDPAKLEKDPTPVNSPKIEKASDSVDPAKLEKDPTPVNFPKIQVPAPTAEKTVQPQPAAPTPARRSATPPPGTQEAGKPQLKRTHSANSLSGKPNGNEASKKAKGFFEDPVRTLTNLFKSNNSTTSQESVQTAPAYAPTPEPKPGFKLLASGDISISPNTVNSKVINKSNNIYPLGSGNRLFNSAEGNSEESNAFTPLSQTPKPDAAEALAPSNVKL